MDRAMAMQRRRRRLQPRNGSIVSVAATKGSSSEQYDNSQGGREQDDNPQEAKRTRYSGLTLPEDILCHIHSLLPLRDAAHAACVSYAFLNSWRCRPNLYFSMEALGLEANPYGDDKISMEFTRKVDHILKKHSGIGLRTFSLSMDYCCSVNSCYLDSWLHLALTSLKSSSLCFLGGIQSSTSHAHFYLVRVETRFSILVLAPAPSVRQLDLVASGA